MNNKELQASRKILMLDVKEAAEHVGGVSARTWQRWEKGDFQIPDDVENAMQSLTSKRLDAIEVIDDMVVEKKADSLDIAYYISFAEYRADNRQSTVIDWRLSQSVAAYYFSDGLASLT